MNIVKLEIPKEITHLAGFDLGLSMCKEQIVPMIKDNSVTIQIPEQIEAIALGFVKGLREGLEDYNKDINVGFIANSREMVRKLLDDYDY